MNERILELAEQAGFDIEVEDIFNYKPQHSFIGSDENMKKFAELIVQEAITIVNKRYMGDNNREDMEVRRCVEDLKKNFGVE
jgi:hypothetical protein